MRTSVAVLTLALVAALGMFAPGAAAATLATTKIVIVVGAVGSQTSSFRDSGNAIYAEAIKHSSNVTKVYSPNATWYKVKKAITGANIVVYLGHGNGFPSPYSTSPRPSTQNGFGLNDSTLSDGKHVYYGESYIDDVQLAPNAIVLLHRLCYASGAGEPGHANPTVSTARARVDNYASGFIRAGARAVIADGHRTVANYIKALFTTNQTIDQLWRTTNAYGNIRTFASSRSSGFTGYTDPKYTDRDYYRSMVARPGVTTREITGAVGDTGLDPASFAVPGRASVAADGAELLDVDGQPTGSLAAGTRLSLVSIPSWTALDGAPVLEAVGLDNPSIAGFVRTDQLVPRDSVAPSLLGVGATSTGLSPNGDGFFDTTELSARFSESVDWSLRVDGPNGTVRQASGSGREPAVSWDGLVDGAPLPDGTYTYTFSGQDAWLNAPTPVSRSGTVRIDTTVPVLLGTGTMAASTTQSDAVPWFSPNGDAVRDTIALTGSTSEAGRIAVRIRDAEDRTVRSFNATVSAGSFALAWDGRSDAGTVVPDGTYAIRLLPYDKLENRGASLTSAVQVINLLGAVKSSVALIYPQDGDRLASRTWLSYSLDRQATVTWTIRNSAGTVVETLVDGELRDAGLHSLAFAGRRLDGTMLPVGRYTSHVSATDGVVSLAQSAAFEMNAFSVRSSKASPARGTRVTISAVSAESLSSSVRLQVSQPGKSSWSVTMTRVSTGKYKATVTLRTGGSAGTVTFRVQATDSRGLLNRTYLKLPLR